MRKPLRLLWVCLFSCLCLVSVWAADLKTYKEVYQKNSESISQTYRPKFDDLQQQYQKSLEALKSLAVKQGDLPKAKAAITEVDRFQKAKSLPATLDERALPEIKACQTDYVKRYAKLEQDMTAELGTLTAKYEQALDRLQKELTRAEKFDEATAVMDEREKAQTALKGYADRFAALTGATATNATRTAVLRTAAEGKLGTKHGQYLVVDLSRGPKASKCPVTYLADVPKGGWSDEYKTEKLVLRKLEPGTFIMGSPESELGHRENETQHEVTLTRAFYIGVFEVTQKQWERVMGDWPSFFNNAKYREARPVEKVSYNAIRGLFVGVSWPVTNSVDSASFLGRLRARTGKLFDLPTEAQWEYACRAGTATALNSGKNLTSVESCPNVAEAGRCKANAGDGAQGGDEGVGTAKVGSYPPNAWGLYDMHGNVWEWCLDWSGRYSGAENDPKGATAGLNRVFRGGSWVSNAEICRSANRNDYTPGSVDGSIGFRVALPSGQQ